MTDIPRTMQAVVLMRHGVAQHNLLDPVTGQAPNLLDPALLDPPLVYQGKQQALESGERLQVWYKATQAGEYPQLVVVSPLTRCIQTATIALLPGSRYTLSQSEPAFCCTELVREAFGMHYPDQRRPKSILQRHWPALAFDPNMTEADTAWRPDARESIQDVQQRIAAFWEFLVQRPEDNIVVVSHGVWIEACIHRYCPEALDHGRQRVYNCDMFAIECNSKDGRFVGVSNARKL